MVNYEYGKIYKLYSKQNNITYIGSTTEYYLSKRLSKHISNYKQYLNNKGDYIYSFKVLECEDYKIELLEDYPCANKQQLSKREGYYIKNNECVNKYIPGRTIAEWYEDNKDKIKEYYKNNRDNIKKQVQEYQINNKDKINEYREANEDKIKEYKSQKVACECGCMIVRSNIAVHKKSKKHIKLMDLVQNKDNIKANTINKVVCDCGCIVNRIHDLARHKTTTKHIKLVQNKL